MIEKIYIQNYKIFESFSLNLNKGLNIIVGNNEEGKSTILEAINLALTKRINGGLIEYEMTPYFFNSKCVSEYIASLRSGTPLPLPEMFIELYFKNEPLLASFQGTNNSLKEDAVGIKLKAVFNEEYSEEYTHFIANHKNTEFIPTEFYTFQWQGFDDNAITSRKLPISVSYIDATTIRLQSGTDYYLQDIIRKDLSPSERVGLSMAYRELKEKFSQEPSIQTINDQLTTKTGAISDQSLSIAIDISQKTNWEASLIPHLNKLPFQLIGKGEQNALKILLALERDGGKSSLILIEEPENHLSFPSMNKLVKKITEKCTGKQIIVTTHSAYVLNKLGLENLILLHEQSTLRLDHLSAGTHNYFKKLAGYDTLRLVLAKKTILVEGPSDELIVQKAYLDKHSCLPIEAEIDVLSVKGLSFLRFLEIAKELNKSVTVVTDNDGDYEAVDTKYAAYAGIENIKIFRSNDNSAKTLEPQIVECNTLATLNALFGKTYPDKSSMATYMEANKTECALKIFESPKDAIVFPQYIKDAIES